MGKFSKQAAKFEVDLGALFNRAIRQALLSGLAMAVRTTHSTDAKSKNKGSQDSSNSAAHWTIKAKGVTRTSGRAWTRLRDLRHTSTRARTGSIGRRRDKGINKDATISFVRDREMRDVVEKFVSGRSPTTVFSFFNPIDESSEYGERLNLSEAGQAAVEEVHRIFRNRINAGQARKRRL